MFDASWRRRAKTCASRTVFLTTIVGALSACGSAASQRGAAAPLAEPRASASPREGRGATREDALGRSVLRRSDFVRAVLSRNPSLEAGRQATRAALARVRQAGAFEDPMLELGLAPLSIAPSDAPIGYEVTLSQRLPWFGKRGLERTLASAEAEAMKADYEAMRRELGLSAVVLYDQYYVSVRSLEINAQHVELMGVMRDAATAQFESGHASAQDPLQAEAELAHMEHDAVRLASQRDVIVAQMNELLHRAPELPLPPPPPELPPAEPVDELSAPKLEQQALSASTELDAMKQRIRAEQARADRAERERYPDLTVSASYNSMWDMPEHRFMVGLGLNIPLPNERRSGAVDEAMAARAQLEAEVNRLTDAARTRVFVTLKQLRESSHVLRLFETRLLPVAREQIEAARAGFATSRNAFTAVIDAERNLRNVQLEQQTARAEYYRRRAELDRALGRIPGLDWKEQDR